MPLLNVPSYNQLDYYYGQQSNRFNNCGPTCLTDIYKYLTGKFVNPDLIHDQMVGDQDAGYTSTSDLRNWLSGRGIPSSYASPSYSAYISTIKAALDKGHTVIVLIYANRTYNTGGHFMVARGYGNGKINLANPWGGIFEDLTESTLLGETKYSLVIVGQTGGTLPGSTADEEPAPPTTLNPPTTVTVTPTLWPLDDPTSAMKISWARVEGATAYEVWASYNGAAATLLRTVSDTPTYDQLPAGTTSAAYYVKATCGSLKSVASTTVSGVPL